MQAQVVQVQPPRAFCADAAASSAAPSASAWGEPLAEPLPQHSPQQAPRPEPVATAGQSELAPEGSQRVVIPQLTSPNTKQDMKAFVMESGPYGDNMVQCQLQAARECYTWLRVWNGSDQGATPVGT